MIQPLRNRESHSDLLGFSLCLAVNKDLAEGLLEKEREPRASKVDTWPTWWGPSYFFWSQDL